MASFFFPQAALRFPRPHGGTRLYDQPLRIAGVNLLLAPARIIISTPWAIRIGHVLLKTLQASGQAV
jgi:hypothetical protein